MTIKVNAATKPTDESPESPLTAQDDELYGSWEVLRTGRGPLNPRIIREAVTSGRYVAEINPTTSDNEVGVDGRARLIAASPVLLLAAELALKALENPGNGLAAKARVYLRGAISQATKE